MKSRPWFTVCLLGIGLFYLAAGAKVRGHEVDDSSAAKIQLLITQLGDDQYIVRQQAESQLLEYGAEAFAALQAAEMHADLEVATRAKYILNQVRIEWTRPTDSKVVRIIMDHYGDLSPRAQLKKIAKLAVLDDLQGLGALCRIVRFDSSMRNSRLAVLAILEQGILLPEQIPVAVEMLEREAAGADQGLMALVQIYLSQIQSPTVIDPRWLARIDGEINSLEGDLESDQRSFVASLIRGHLDMCNAVSDVEGIFACLQRSIELSTRDYGDASKSLEFVLKWILDHEQWEVLPRVEEQYSEAIQSERMLLYLVAMAKGRQGLIEESENLAAEAYHEEFLIDESTPKEKQEFEIKGAPKRYQIAETIAEMGRHDWAEREWDHVIATLPATDYTALSARLSKAMFCLHDRGQDQEAAKLLGETIEAIENDPATRSLYQKNRNLQAVLNAFRSNHDYFLACHFESKQEYEKQQQYLANAYKLNRDNADVLIAMYRLQDASDTYRKSTRQKITLAKKKLEITIRQQPGNAHSYNHWAWLVSNTEGNFNKAVERSQRSLQLEPDSPSYLDTLGRCYYAAGDLENAVEVQRRAVAKHPHLLVMQSQLELFESELAKQTKTAN